MLKDFFAGITSYTKAIQLISEMRLWKFILAPALLSLLLAGGIGTTSWAFADNLGYWLVSWYPFDIGASFLTGISMWVGGLLIVILGLILYKHIVLVIASPFMSPLAQKVEEHITGQHTNYKGFQWNRAIKEIFRGLHLALRNIFREILFVAPLFLLSFIPGVGLIPVVLIFLIQAYYAGFGNIDYTLERHFSVKDSIRFVRQNKGLALGNGTVFMLLLMTGIGFLIALPLGTIAGTVESIKRLDTRDLETIIDEEYV